jgi:hypothetical protein
MTFEIKNKTEMLSIMKVLCFMCIMKEFRRVLYYSYLNLTYLFIHTLYQLPNF